MLAAWPSSEGTTPRHFLTKVLVLNNGVEFPAKHCVKTLHCVAIIRPFCLWSGRFCHDLRVMNIMSRLLIQMAGIIVRYRVSVLIFHTRSEAQSSSRGSEEERRFLLVQRILQRSALHLNMSSLKQRSTQLWAAPNTDSAARSKGTSAMWKPLKLVLQIVVLIQTCLFSNF